MLYNQHNLDVAKFAATQKGARPALKHVLLSPRKTVATDSYRLVEVSVPETKTTYPKSHLRDWEPFMVSPKALKGIKAPKFKKNTEANYVAVKSIREDGTLADLMTLSADYEEQVRTVDRKPDKFPAYDHLFPGGEPAMKIRVNGRYLAEVAGMLGKMSASEEIEMNVYGAMLAVVLRAHGPEGQIGRAIVMPIG